MKTCQSCQHWEDGCCEFVDLMQVEATLNQSNVEIVVKVADDTGLNAKLKTGPNFGCIHHKDKE